MKISLLEFSEKDDPYACTNYESFEEQPDEFLVSSHDHLDAVVEKAKKLAMIVLHNRSIAAAIGEADASAEDAVLSKCNALQKRLYKIWKTGGEMPEMAWACDEEPVSKRQRTMEHDENGEELVPVTICWALAELYRLPAAEKRQVTRKDVQTFFSQYTSLRPLLDVMHKIVRLRTGADGPQESLIHHRAKQEQEATRRSTDAIAKQYAIIKSEAQKQFYELEESLEIIRERLRVAKQEDKRHHLSRSEGDVQEEYREDAQVPAAEAVLVAGPQTLVRGDDSVTASKVTSDVEALRSEEVEPQQTETEPHSHTRPTDAVAVSVHEAQTHRPGPAVTERANEVQDQNEHQEQVGEIIPPKSLGLHEEYDIVGDKPTLSENDEESFFSDLFSSPLNDFTKGVETLTVDHPIETQTEGTPPAMVFSEPTATLSLQLSSHTLNAGEKTDEVEEGEHIKSSMASTPTVPPQEPIADAGRKAPPYSSHYSQPSSIGGTLFSKRSCSVFQSQAHVASHGPFSAKANMDPPPIPLAKATQLQVLFPTSHHDSRECLPPAKTSNNFSISASQRQNTMEINANARGHQQQPSKHVTEHRAPNHFHSYDNLESFT